MMMVIFRWIVAASSFGKLLEDQIYFTGENALPSLQKLEWLEVKPDLEYTHGWQEGNAS